MRACVRCHVDLEFSRRGWERQAEGEMKDLGIRERTEVGVRGGERTSGCSVGSGSPV